MEPYDLHNVLETLNDISHANDNQEICCICQDILDNGEQVYELPECNHMFHTNCVMTWFRHQNVACPYCANPGINEKKREIFCHSRYGGYNNAKMLMKKTNYKQLIQILNHEKCPKGLKKRYDEIGKRKDKFEYQKKEYKLFKKNEKDQLAYGEACKITSHKWKQLRTLGEKFHQAVLDFIEYPVVPIIIPLRN